jgi:hypothetical protein
MFFPFERPGFTDCCKWLSPPHVGRFDLWPCFSFHPSLLSDPLQWISVYCSLSLSTVRPKHCSPPPITFD